MSQIIPSKIEKHENDSNKYLPKSRNNFEEFCEETTLNGWYYMAKQNLTKCSRLFWASMILSSIGLAFFFCIGIVTEFMNSNVIITVDSVSASLDNVLFPSMLVCNQNQVRDLRPILEFQPCWNCGKSQFVN